VSEADEQKEIVRWFKYTYPEYAMSLRMSQSGSFRGAGRKGAIRTANMKAMGAITGESDIAILLPRGGFGALLVEHKKDDAMIGATGKQLEYLRYHNAVGNCGVVTKGVDMAKAAIKQYMGLEVGGKHV